MTSADERLTASVRRASRAMGAVRGFFSGVGLLFRGFGMWATSPKLMLLGAVPALIVSLVYAALLVLLALNLGTIAEWLTPFAAGWDEVWRVTVRVIAGAAVVGVAVLLAVYTFAALTLAVGDPFYERIWRDVENRLGGVPDDGAVTFWESVGRGIGGGLRMLLATAAVGVGLFVIGFIPVAGPVIAVALGALVGGWFLAVELCGFAFDARGLTLRERRRMLARRRSRTVGFGMAAYVLFLIPLVAVVLMPSAVAGAALLSRAVLEEAGERPAPTS